MTKQVFKVLRRDGDELTSSVVTNSACMRYVPQTWCSPPVGPSLCFDSLESAKRYARKLHSIAIVIWACEARRVRPVHMLPVWDGLVESFICFWRDRNRPPYLAIPLYPTPRGTVACDEVKLVEEVWTCDVDIRDMAEELAKIPTPRRTKEKPCEHSS